MPFHYQFRMDSECRALPATETRLGSKQGEARAPRARRVLQVHIKFGPAARRALECKWGQATRSPGRQGRLAAQRRLRRHQRRVRRHCALADMHRVCPACIIDLDEPVGFSSRPALCTRSKTPLAAVSRSTGRPSWARGATPIRRLSTGSVTSSPAEMRHFCLARSCTCVRCARRALSCWRSWRVAACCLVTLWWVIRLVNPAQSGSTTSRPACRWFHPSDKSNIGLWRPARFQGAAPSPRQ